MRMCLTKIILYFLMFALLLFFVFPIFWVGLTSFKNRGDAFAYPPKFIFTPTLENFGNIYFQSDFSKYMKNSLIVAFSTVFFSLLLGLPAAYYISRFKIKRKGDLVFWILSTRMLPPIGLAVPIFLIAHSLNLIDTKVILIILYLSFNLSFVIWLMKGFFDEQPSALDEAALLDGCTPFGSLLRVNFPLAVPGISVTAVFSFIFTWNEFLYAYVLTRLNARTVSVAIIDYLGWVEIRWGEMCVASITAMLPPIILAIFVRRYLVKGLTFGAFK